jgi:hypothetical protein
MQTGKQAAKDSVCPCGERAIVSIEQTDDNGNPGKLWSSCGDVDCISAMVAASKVKWGVCDVCGELSATSLRHMECST